VRRVEVRCCCNASQLLGTLPFPDRADEFIYPLVQPKTTDFLRAARRGVRSETLTLRLHPWKDSRMEFDGTRVITEGVALKADGIPIETLRRIPGFIEAHTRFSLVKETP
jgi:hypothetical protein